MILEKLNKQISSKGKYICITKPRRFGKSSIADMLGAYYSKAFDSKNIFDNLNISKSESYEENINKYNVINISFNKIPERCSNYSDYIGMIITSLIDDITEVFQKVKTKKYFTIGDMLLSTNEKFVFILDEWDYIFSHNLFEEHQNDFLEFLRNLLKDKPYVALAYMTGVLPIKKYSEGSALNMFREYTMLNDRIYADYFGFTENEVKRLCYKNGNMDYEEIKEWYNGYITNKGNNIYNPRSVICALSDEYCQSYWTSTGAMDEVLYYLKYNIAEVRDDVIEMVSGNSIDIILEEEYRAGQKNLETREEIYSAMVIYGFLSYYDGTLKIPNKELMKEFEKALRDESFGKVMDIVKNDIAFILELKKNSTPDEAIKQIKEICSKIYTRK